jgi:cytoskeletal protein CcmA (bactofilin family)
MAELRIVRAGPFEGIGRNETMAVENIHACIGKTVLIQGEVKGSEDLMVDGRVEGTINLSESRLTIGPNAKVAADISAKDVVILGQLRGNVTASGRVELRAGCSVEGDIRALRLAVEDNAIFCGKVDLTQAVSSGAGAHVVSAQ